MALCNTGSRSRRGKVATTMVCRRGEMHSGACERAPIHETTYCRRRREESLISCLSRNNETPHVVSYSFMNWPRVSTKSLSAVEARHANEGGSFTLARSLYKRQIVPRGVSVIGTPSIQS